TRLDTRLLRMLGLRYLASNVPLALPDLTAIATEGERTLYELRDPNLASYSPTRLHPAPDARAMLAALADPALDPRLDVVGGDDAAVDGALVPASDTLLTFVRGGFHVSA